ncbi:hypothetical protein HPB52_024265 [Rhipicephalus sanguineus]|uniref:Uncharacterized protein n=1 Tax=Rhipicephalus sanguineus TaxID=34632 RepID=A0A9D4YRD1_RHISA|nr:hypothetical protein HPB52_024265 [Rhipicephalus sanguineus]
MLRTEGPQRWIFQELQELWRIAFRFKGKDTPQSYVRDLAGMLHLFPFQDVLAGPYLLEEYRPDLINDLLHYLRPDNVRIAVVAKRFMGQADSVEKWYGTQYNLEPIPDSVMQDCVAEAATVRPRDGATVGAVIIIMRMDSGDVARGVPGTLENFCLVSGIDEAKRLSNVVPAALEGSAKLWWQFVGAFNSWDEFTKTFRAEFASIDSKRRLKEELEQRTQHPRKI